jgi:hypothetical protein
MTTFRIVAGTDILAARPLPASPTADGRRRLAREIERGNPLEFFDEIDELFRRHKEAYGAYRKAVAEVAERTGHRVTVVGHKIAAEHRRRTIAARKKPAVEPSCPMDYNLI